MTRQTRIHAALSTALKPLELNVIDDSARHAGHAGASPDGETHYNVEITAAVFAGLSRVAMQRTVMDALKSEFDTGLHALSIKARAP
ncbi:MAG: BolA family transcriptional regulator [Henriciella sp.]|nr:BolA family transcriptional regulator [Henriciella sp.]